MKLIQSLVGGGLMALFCFCGGAHAGFLTDADKDWQEEAEVPFPPAPKEADLHRFYVSATTPNAFFIDMATLSVGQDGVVRFVMVVRSPRGASNITFEGIRCASSQRRLYAIGQADGTWVASRNTAWEGISFNTYNRAQAALAKEYFCDGTTATAIDADEVRRRIEKGTARGFNPALDEQGRM